ncbi:MAG: AMP-binding protein, partial [Chloroflexi bacterium]|nr:AMP-binding protein [Chloroflexota bacterium]
KQGFWSHDEDFIDSNAILYPGKEALVDYKVRLTYSELKQRVDRLAVSFLNMGFKKDQVILLQLPNIVEHIIVHEALRKAGIISISPRMDMRHKEIEYALSKSEAVAVVIVKEYRNFNFYQMIKDLHQGLPGLRDIFIVGDDVPSGCFSINEIIQKPIKGKYSLADLEEVHIKPVDVQSISITSGTTGFPKLSEAMAGVSWIKGVTGVERWKVTGGDIFLALSPISGGGALPCIIAAPRTASKIVLFEISGKFDSDEAFKVIEKEKVTFACGVPAQMTMMIKNPNINKYDLSSLRVFYYAGASLPYSIAKEIEDTMGCRVLTLLDLL